MLPIILTTTKIQLKTLIRFNVINRKERLLVNSTKQV